MDYFHIIFDKLPSNIAKLINTNGLNFRKPPPKVEIEYEQEEEKEEDEDKEEEVEQPKPNKQERPKVEPTQRGHIIEIFSFSLQN